MMNATCDRSAADVGCSSRAFPDSSAIRTAIRLITLGLKHGDVEHARAWQCRSLDLMTTGGSESQLETLMLLEADISALEARESVHGRFSALSSELPAIRVLMEKGHYAPPQGDPVPPPLGLQWLPVDASSLKLFPKDYPRRHPDGPETVAPSVPKSWAN